MDTLRKFPRGARVLLNNARFADVGGGCYYPAGTGMLIQDGHILGLPGLPGETAETRPDIIVDLEGKAVIPGLFNTHTHIGSIVPSLNPALRDLRVMKDCAQAQIEKSLVDCLAHGITHVRDGWADDLLPNRALRQRIALGELRGPRIIQCVAVGQPGGYLIGSLPLAIRLLAGGKAIDYSSPNTGVVIFPADGSAQQARDAVDRAIDERGAESIKIGEEFTNMMDPRKACQVMTPAQLRAVADQARKRGIKTTMHHSAAASLCRAAEAGVDALVHTPCDLPLSEADIQACAAAGCMIEPTLSVPYSGAWRLQGEREQIHPRLTRLASFRAAGGSAYIEEYWIPEMKRTVREGMQRLGRGQYKVFGLVDFAGPLRAALKQLTLGMDNFKRLYQAGLRATTSNDANKAPVTTAMLDLELELFDFLINGERQVGEKPFTPADALRAATLHGAQALGVDDRFGTLEPGKIADLVVLDGDPLADFRLIGSRAAAVMLDGQWI